MFTVLREPISRLLSNYLYDKQRGVWDGGLEEYIQIDWKQNYLLRFLGSGEVNRGREGHQSLDHCFTLDELEPRLVPVLREYGLPLLPGIPRENISDTRGNALPDDLSYRDGIKIGKYAITQACYEMITYYNSDDIQFFAEVKGSQGDSVSNFNISTQKEIAGRQQPILAQIGRHYRNLIYKPAVLHSLGHHALPRNAVSPDQVDADNAFSV